jgi:hypothetical protein
MSRAVMLHSEGGMYEIRERAHDLALRLRWCGRRDRDGLDGGGH